MSIQKAQGRRTKDELSQIPLEERRRQEGDPNTDPEERRWMAELNRDELFRLQDENKWRDQPLAPQYLATDYNRFSQAVKDINPTLDYQGRSKFAQDQISDMEQYMLDQERRGLGQLRMNALRNAAGARNAMAMRGGLTGGAAERLGAQANQQANLGYGNMLSQGNLGRMQNRLAIGDTDYNRQREDTLNKAKFDYGRASDIQSAYEREVGRQNMFNMGRYKEQMGAWGAARTADAQEKAAQEASKK